VTDKGWQLKFEEPIPLLDGRKLIRPEVLDGGREAF
jgi:hypothetical protein